MYILCIYIYVYSMYIYMYILCEITRQPVVSLLQLLLYAPFVCWHTKAWLKALLIQDVARNIQ